MIFIHVFGETINFLSKFLKVVCFKKSSKIKTNVSDSENLWLIEFYFYGNVKFSSFNMWIES